MMAIQPHVFQRGLIAAVLPLLAGKLLTRPRIWTFALLGAWLLFFLVGGI